MGLVKMMPGLRARYGLKIFGISVVYQLHGEEKTSEYVFVNTVDNCITYKNHWGSDPQKKQKIKNDK